MNYGPENTLGIIQCEFNYEHFFRGLEEPNEEQYCLIISFKNEPALSDFSAKLRTYCKEPVLSKIKSIERKESREAGFKLYVGFHQERLEYQEAFVALAPTFIILKTLFSYDFHQICMNGLLCQSPSLRSFSPRDSESCRTEAKVDLIMNLGSSLSLEDTTAVVTFGKVKNDKSRQYYLDFEFTDRADATRCNELILKQSSDQGVSLVTGIVFDNSRLSIYLKLKQSDNREIWKEIKDMILNLELLFGFKFSQSVQEGLLNPVVMSQSPRTFIVNRDNGMDNITIKPLVNADAQKDKKCIIM